MKKLIKAFKAWRKKCQHQRDWPVEDQILWVRQMVADDHQWLGHDPVANALCARYRAMLSDRWESVPIERVDHLRERLGLDPHAKKGN